MQEERLSREKAFIYIFVNPSHMQRVAVLQLEAEQCQGRQQERETFT